MGFWKRRYVRITAFILAFLLVIQFGTYWAYAQRVMPKSALRELRDFGLLKGKDFVLVDEATWASMSSDQQASLTAELHKYVPTVYHALSDVPDNLIVAEPITQKDRDDYERWKAGRTTTPQTLDLIRHEIETGRRIRGFKNGWKVEWRSEESGFFWTRCSAAYQEGDTSSEGTRDLYVWVIGVWVRVRNDGGYMS